MLNVLIKIGNLVPGRFRYDKDSDEEEEDDDEEEDYGFSYERRVELYDKHETFSSLNDINNEDMNNKTDNEYNNHEVISFLIWGRANISLNIHFNIY